MSGDAPPRYVDARTLREMFNMGGYLDRVRRGALREHVIANAHPSPPLAEEPFCTRSQIVAYLTPSGNEVALVHQYLRPDGTIGLSGVPDPKRVLDRGTLYILRE